MTEIADTCTVRPRLSVQSLLRPTAVWVVLLCIQNWQSMIVVSVVLLTWVFGCNRTRKAVWWVSPAAFLPPLAVIAMLFTSGETTTAKFTIVQQWAVFPGMFVERLFSDYLANSRLLTIPLLIAVCVTSVCFLAAVTCIRFVPKSRSIVVTLVFLLSLLSSIAYLIPAN